MIALPNEAPFPMYDSFAGFTLLSPETRTTLHGLERVTSLMSRAHNAQDALEKVGRVLTDVLHANRWSIMLKTELDVIRISLAKGLPEHVIASTQVRIGEGIAGRVAQRGEGELFANVEYEVGTTSGGTYDSTSAICVPMRLGSDVLGVINLSDKSIGPDQVGPFNANDLTLALMTANQAALMIEMLRTREAARGRGPSSAVEPNGSDAYELLKQASAFDLLRQVTDLMTISDNIDQVLDAVINGACRLLSATRGSLMLYDAASKELRIRAAIGMSSELVGTVHIRLGEGIAGRVLETGEPLLITDAPRLRLGSHQPAVTDQRAAQYRNQSALCVPMKIRGRILGVFNVNDRIDQQDFSENDLYIARVIANQAAVAISAAHLLTESIASAELHRSLEIAHEIQDKLIPPIPTIPGVDIARLSDACESAGGDYIDYFPVEGEHDLSQGRFYIACGDVSGHGVGSALIMAMGRAFLRALLQQDTCLSTVLHKMNNLIEADTPAGQFMTLFVGLLDVSTGCLSYASAGHEPTSLYQVATDAIIVTETTGLPLGMFEDQDYTVGQLEVRPGDVLALATDGIAEAMNIEGGYYGRDRLQQDLRELHALPAAEIVTEIKRRVLSFVYPQLLRDDLSLIVVKLESGDH
jgi:sigma-B regulation protein RsbU (phosphoserine phosphatase)